MPTQQQALNVGCGALITCLPFKQLQMAKDKRPKRDLHALDGDGMLMCNPRDKEAAHRAQTEKIATDNWKAVTCSKCISLIYKRNKALRERKEVN
jgi:dissimilatory sulfite reductase (desulfoviridin) alpha/beta subunit